MDKTLKNPGDVLNGLQNGMTLLVGGFGLSGNPEHLINAVHGLGYQILPSSVTMQAQRTKAWGFCYKPSKSNE